MDRFTCVPRLVAGVAVACVLSENLAEGGQSIASGDLFGPTPETSRPVSAVGLSVYGGAGDSAGVGAAPNDPLLGGPFYAGFFGGLGHRRRSSRNDFAAAAATSYRYFPETRELLNLEGSGAVRVGSQIGERGLITLRQTAQYTRFRQISLAPPSPTVPDSGGEIPTSNPEGSATVGQPFYDLTTGVTFSQAYGPRSGLSADYAYRININSEWAERPTTHEARLRYERGATQRTSFWLGTAYRTGRTGFEAGTPTIHASDFEGGVGYSRRKTTLGASAGVTLVSRGDLPADVPAGSSDYAIVAAVVMTRQVAETWTFQADYGRRLQFVDAFPDPFAADQANVMLTGQLGRRANARARLNYWTGTAVSTTASPDQRADGWQVSAGFDFGISRRMQGYTLYNYTANEFSDGALASLPPGVLPRTNWGGVRAGITMWASHIH
jgi:hypothetical protein